MMKRTLMVAGIAGILALGAMGAASAKSGGQGGGGAKQRARIATALVEPWFTETQFSVRLVDASGTGLNGKTVTLAFPADEFGAAHEACAGVTQNQSAPPKQLLGDPPPPKNGTMVCSLTPADAARAELSAMEYRFAGDASYFPSVGWKSGVGCAPEGYPTPDGPGCVAAA